MILSSYAAMRRHLSPRKAISNASNNGSGLVRVFLASTAGIAKRNLIQIGGINTGTVEANGTWNIAAIGTNYVDLAGSTFANAWTAALVANYWILDEDGFPHFPGPLLPDGSIDGSSALATSQSKIRENGFGWDQLGQTRQASGYFVLTTSGATTFANTRAIGPLIDPTKIGGSDPGFPFTLSLAGIGNDATPGTHDYNWYLSQRRDPGWVADPTGTKNQFWNRQPFVLTQPSAVNSSSVVININTPAVAALLPGLAGNQLVQADALEVLFRHVVIICQRVTDGSIQWASFYAPVAPAGTD